MSDPEKPSFDFAANFKCIPNPEADRLNEGAVRPPAPTQPNTVYLGRPNHCGGAYLPNVYGTMTRTNCRDSAVPGTALCDSCGKREREMRAHLLAKQREAAQPAHDTSKRSRWSR